MNVTVSVNGKYMLNGIQLEGRKLIPRWLGDLILWCFFHRLDTETEIVLTGFSQSTPKVLLD